MTGVLQIVALLSAALPLVLGAPVNPEQSRSLIPGKYIVTLKPGASVQTDSHLAWVTNVQRRNLNGLGSSLAAAGVENTYSVGSWQGYSGDFDDATIEEIRNNDDVESVEEDYIMYLDESLLDERDVIIQSGATHGLGTISNRGPGNTTYTYDASAGQDTFAYVVDSGIVKDHVEFEGRAIFGWTGYEGDETDTFGHGTHVAGTIGGAQYGVSKQTTLIDVKVFQGATGSASIVLAGFGWAVNDIVSKGRAGRSVINMSLGGPASNAWQTAVNAAYDQGVISVAASGNGIRGVAQPAANYSPANVATAITVGAIDSTWTIGAFSNYGPEVDILAPGVGVTSAWIGSNTATRTISGTSMAAPHVAGLAVYLQALEGLSAPKQIADRLVDLATVGLANGDLKGSPNRIAYNGHA